MRKETLLKIMGLFRRELDRGFTILEIAKKLKIGYRPAYNHIHALLEEQIITVQIIGKAKQCHLNLESVKSRHLLAEVDILRKEELFKENIKLRKILEGLTEKLTEKFASEIHSIILFGSYAKGKATKTSDIDVLFIVSDMKNKELRKEIEREGAGFQYSHNIKVSPVISDIKEFKKMLSAKEEVNIGKEVRAEGIPLYGWEQFWRLMA